MEYRKRCKVCGKIWCYTDEDLKNDSLNRLASTASAIGGIANLLGGGSIFHQQYFADRAEHSLDQIVDRFQCPHCHSRDIEDLTEEEWQRAQQPQEQKPELARIVINSNATPEALLKRAKLFLEDEDWASAKAYCENVLDADPENATAYVIKLMSELRVKEQDELANQEKPFDAHPDYQKALRFADDTLAAVLKGYIEQINNRIKQEELEAQYEQACSALACAETEEDYRKAGVLFIALSDYKDSAEKETVCHEKLERLQEEEKARQAQIAKEEAEAKVKAEARAIQSRAAAKKFAPIVAAVTVVIIAATLIVTKVIMPANQYHKAQTLLDAGEYDAAAEAFAALGNYRDAKKRVDYTKGERHLSKGEYEAAVSVYSVLGDYADSTDKLLVAQEEIYQQAIAFENLNNYAEAKRLYSTVEDYKDTKKQIEQLFRKAYNDGLEKMQAKDYQEAQECFAVVTDQYPDALNYCNYCNIKAINFRDGTIHNLATIMNVLNKITDTNLQNELRSIPQIEMVYHLEGTWVQDTTYNPNTLIFHDGKIHCKSGHSEYEYYLFYYGLSSSPYRYGYISSIGTSYDRIYSITDTSFCSQAIYDGWRGLEEIYKKQG